MDAQSASPESSPQHVSFQDIMDHFQRLYQNAEFDVLKEQVEALLKDNPDHPVLYNFLGVADVATGQLQSAIGHYKKAIELQPGYAVAYNNMGNAFYLAKQHQEALRCFEKALEVQPSYAQALCNLANIYGVLGDTEKAIAAYRQVIESKPDTALAHYNLMELLEKLNREEELKGAYGIAQQHLRDHPYVQLFKGIIERRENQLEQAKHTLESVKLEKVDAKHELFRISMLAKLCDRLELADEAMAYFEKANHLTKQSYPSADADKQRYWDHIELWKSQFTHENVSKWNKVAASSITPVFLVGFPRSGTTLLDTILRSHSDIEVIEERPMVGAMINALFPEGRGDLSRLSTMSDEVLQAAREAYEQGHAKHTTGSASVVIDKLPLNMVEAGVIARVYPNAKFIMALRHPCDCVLSCFMQKFDVNPAMASFFDLADSAYLYEHVMQLWDQYCKVFELSVHEIRYEDVVKDLKASIEPLLSFLDVSWDDALLSHENTAQERDRINTPSYEQVIQPIYTHAAYRWKRYESNIGPYLPKLERWIDKWYPHA